MAHRTFALLSLTSLLTLPLVGVSAQAASLPATTMHRVADVKMKNSEATQRVAGTVTGITATQIVINGTTYALAASVQVNYHDHQLTASQIPLNAVVFASLNGLGQVTKITLQTDPAMPSGESVTGVITSITATSIQIGSYTLTVDPSASVNFHDRQLTLAQVPTGAQAKVSLDAAGLVTKIHLLTDPTMPRGESTTGVIQQVTATDLQIGTYTLAFASTVSVTFHDHRLTAAQIPVGVEAKVDVNSQGQVTKVRLLADPALPRGESTTGVIQNISASTIQVGTYVLGLATSVAVHYHDYQLTLAQVPVGATAKVLVDRAGLVTAIKLQSDAEIPAQHSFTGTITGLTGSSLQVGSYTLALAPQVKVKYGPYDQLTIQNLPMDVSAQVHINNQLQVTKIKLASDPNLPASNTLVGSLTAISGTSLTVGGYTLPIEAGVQIPAYQGQSYSLTQIQIGWTVKVKIDSEGVVRKIDIRSGPAAPSSSGGSQPSSSPSPSGG